MNDRADAELQTRQKNKKRIKKKLIPSVLAGFSLPFTLFVFGPFDVFAQNRAEFAFTLYDFLLPSIIVMLLLGTVLSLIGLFLRKKAYSLYTALLFWCSVMLYLQGNYLNFGLSSLEGDGVSPGAGTVTVIINTLIWVITLVALVIATLKFKMVRKKLKTVVSFGLALIIFMEAVGVVAVSFEDDLYATKEDVLASQSKELGARVLTTENLTTLSANGNAVVFVVDRFDTKYYRSAMIECPEIFSELTGFTYYSNHISLYARTFPAVTHMLTGHENDISKSRLDYFKDAYSNAEYLEYMHGEGYDVNVYTDSYYSYDNASHMMEYTDNITSYTDFTVTDRGLLVWDMFRLSLYRYLPYALKWTVSGISTDDFSDYVEYGEAEEFRKYSSDNKVVYDEITRKDFSLSDKGESGQFSFIHVSGCHMPSDYDENWNEVEGGSRSITNVMKQSFAIINRYISEMKRLGVYDDATIVITGDHAAAMSDKKPLEGSRVTAMLVKARGVSEGEISENKAPTCHDDIWATVIDSEGLDGAGIDKKGVSMLEIDENSDRTRRYVFHRMDGEDSEELVYEVRGNANDFVNWRLVSTREIKRIYD